MSAADFDQLAAAVLDGSASADDYAALEATLDADAAAFDRFVRLAEIHATLGWELQYSRLNAERGSRNAETVEPTPQQTYPIYRKGYEPKPARFRPHHFAISGVAAALLAACGVAIYLLAFNAWADPEPADSQPGPPIATLIQSTGTVIANDNIANEGNDYPAGTYSIDSGSAQFLLRSRVTVDLKGKTRLRMHNPMSASLTRGSASFKCPPGTEGFTVHLDGGVRVVDLGTRFSVAHGSDGHASVRVTEGSVRIEHNDPDHPSPILLNAGAVCSFARSETTDDALRIVRVADKPTLLAEFKFDTGSNLSSADLTGISISRFETYSPDEINSGVSELTDCAFVRAFATTHTEADALAGGTYLSFTATAEPGRRLDLHELRLRFGGSRKRPQPWDQTLLLQTSVGGFGPEAPVIARIHRTSSGDGVYKGYAMDYDKPRPIRLDDAGFVGLETIQFRFYFFNSDPNTEGVHRIDDVRLLGETSEIKTDPTKKTSPGDTPTPLRIPKETHDADEKHEPGTPPLTKENHHEDS